MALEVDGKIIATDKEGYLENRDDWSNNVAAAIAGTEGLEISDNHWDVINFLRTYYDEYRVTPSMRVLTRFIGRKLGKDKGDSKYLYQLFPCGPAKQACKIAGLPKPTGCI
jgi:tRNA 2-thiouridine synthesizing protein E